MLKNETIGHQLYVAPCLNCGATSIKLMHFGHGLLNYGGGECAECEHQRVGPVEQEPTQHDLAHVWNVANDIKMLIRAEQIVILRAKLHIALLSGRLLPTFYLLNMNDSAQRLMHAPALPQCVNNDVLPREGCGVWATATHKSNVAASAARPTWATHVVWYF